jgi:thioredoxin reductase (NADPH)
MNKTKVIIIGCGPAGIATGIQLKRCEIDHIILEKDEIGGLLHNANLIENYPGFPGGISGQKLIEIIKKQAKDFDLNIVHDEVITLNRFRRDYVINTVRDIYRADIVMVASGTKPVTYNHTEIPADLPGRVLYEIKTITDIRTADIAIIGGGDAAFDYALNLSRNNKILLFNRGKKTNCLPLLYQRVISNANITYIEKADLKIIKRSSDSNMAIKFNVAGRSSAYNVNYLVFAIGRVPQIDFVSDEIKEGYEKYMLEGTLHFIGDVKNGDYRQCAIAMGDGIKAAMMIYNNLRSRKK